MSDPVTGIFQYVKQFIEFISSFVMLSKVGSDTQLSVNEDLLSCLKVLNGTLYHFVAFLIDAPQVLTSLIAYFKVSSKYPVW